MPTWLQPRPRRRRPLAWSTAVTLGVPRRRADELAERCQDPRTPALAPRLGTVEPLSVREREVATLAVSGLGNREIADRLYVSKRTVDNHLQRIYTKLGVEGRAGLAEALERSINERPASSSR